MSGQIAKNKRWKKKVEKTLASQVDCNWKRKLAQKEVSNPKKSRQHHEEKVQREDKSEPKLDPSTLLRAEAKPHKELSNVLAIDCEMVGIGHNNKSALARVCIIDYIGEVVLDVFCKPKERITDYRTTFSGIRPFDLLGDEVKSIPEVSEQVRSMITGKIIVGHSINHDLDALLLKHPFGLIRDTASFFIPAYGRKMKLKDLAWSELNWKIQEGEHDPYVDARAALELYKKHEILWEKSMKQRKQQRKASKKKPIDSATTSTVDIFSNSKPR